MLIMDNSIGTTIGSNKTSETRPRTSRRSAATFGNTGGYYSTNRPPQKPFADYRPAPTAYQQYWPLMVFPNNGPGYWY